MGGAVGRMSPRNDVLRRGAPTGTAGEPDKGRRSSHGTRDINGPGIREGGIGHGVRDGHSERRAVVGYVHLEDVAAVKVYSTAERNRRAGGRRTIRVQPCRVVAFVRVLE